MKRACDTEVRPERHSLASRYAGQTVVAIGAHPDDLEIGIGGPLARLQTAGARVVVVIPPTPKDSGVPLAGARPGGPGPGAPTLPPVAWPCGMVRRGSRSGWRHWRRRFSVSSAALRAPYPPRRYGETA